MNSAVSKMIVCTAIALTCAMPGTSEEISVSVNIKGSIDELVVVLEKLRELGIGDEQTASVEEPVRVEMHSVATSPVPLPLPVAPPQPVVPPQAVATISLTQATVIPAQARPGESVLVSVHVADPRGQIDTVAATLHGVNGFMFDLYDNGTHGDAIQGDGVWSYVLQIPTLAGASSYRVVVTAYDRSGDIIEFDNSEGESTPLTTETLLGITH
ncbi:MAG: hypothetical protein IID08_04905 [Candidatus Hydrogenedentes bacterium]|nr:hypothetical protein [Candidatus Hydrogenedentota bacterium]